MGLSAASKRQLLRKSIPAYAREAVGRVKSTVGSALASPRVAIEARRGAQADADRRDVKLARQTSRVQADETTGMGRQILFARGTKFGLDLAVAKRKKQQGP